MWLYFISFLEVEEINRNGMKIKELRVIYFAPIFNAGGG